MSKVNIADLNIVTIDKEATVMDVNTLTTPGIFFTHTATRNTPSPDSPGHWMIWVNIWKDRDEEIMHIAYSFYQRKTAIRSSMNGGDDWSDWEVIG